MLPGQGRTCWKDGPELAVLPSRVRMWPLTVETNTLVGPSPSESPRTNNVRSFIECSFRAQDMGPGAPSG